MNFGEIALCFASGCLGAVAGVSLLFRLAKPRAIITLDFVLKRDPVCPECGKILGTRTFLEHKGTDTFPVSMRR